VFERRRPRLDHEIPSWVRPGAIYFVTVCAELRGKNHFCHPAIGKKIFESVAHRHWAQIWHCELVLLMLDHIHLLLSFPHDRYLSISVRMWKHWLRSTLHIRWQKNFFDHRLRDQENLIQKADYILQNPVRTGLIEDSRDWPYMDAERLTAGQRPAATPTRWLPRFVVT
jgi:putative transposase